MGGANYLESKQKNQGFGRKSEAKKGSTKTWRTRSLTVTYWQLVYV